MTRQATKQERSGRPQGGGEGLLAGGWRGCSLRTCALLALSLLMGGCTEFSPLAPRLPDAVVSVSASDGAYPDKIVVVWNPIDGATAYDVLRAPAREGPYSQRGSVTVSSWEDAGLGEDVRFWYRVAARNAAGASAASLADEGSTAPGAPAVPQAPVGLRASDGDYSNRVVVAWDAVPGATSYNVYRADLPGAPGEYQSSASAATWVDTNVDESTHYWYHVTACNRSGCSPASATDRGFTSAASPAIPAVPVVSASDGVYAQRVVVAWDPVPGATSFQIYRSDLPSGTYARRATVSGTSWSDTDVEQNVVYWYRVAACNSSGCSARSSVEGGHAGGGAADGSSVGSRAHDFTAQTTNGDNVTLSGLRGSVVLLEFWGAWCGPCRASMPHVYGLWETYRSRGLVVLLISTDTTEEASSAYLAAQGYADLTCIWEPGGWNARLVKLYGVNSVPRSVVVDRGGIVRYNGHPLSVSESFIEALLGE